MTELLTERMLLISLTMNQLRTYEDAPEKLEQQLGFPVSRANLSEEVRKAINIKITKMAGAPTREHLWYTYWLVVIRFGPYGAGLVGFKGSPDMMGQVEIGYGIDPAWEGKGYTTEAARAMVGWAFSMPGCHAVIAETDRDNIASQKILQKIGMKVYGETSESLMWMIKREREGNKVDGRRS